MPNVMTAIVLISAHLFILVVARYECHSEERSDEESLICLFPREILRFAQNDKATGLFRGAAQNPHPFPKSRKGGLQKTAMIASRALGGGGAGADGL